MEHTGHFGIYFGYIRRLFIGGLVPSIGPENRPEVITVTTLQLYLLMLGILNYLSGFEECVFIWLYFGGWRGHTYLSCQWWAPVGPGLRCPPAGPHRETGGPTAAGPTAARTYSARHSRQFNYAHTVTHTQSQKYGIRRYAKTNDKLQHR